MEPRDQIAEMLEKAADELDLAMQHFRVATQHYRDRLIPRGCAHAFAAEGHMRNATALSDQVSQIHASHARLQV